MNSCVVGDALTDLILAPSVHWKTPWTQGDGSRAGEGEPASVPLAGQCRGAPVDC